jgi:hypothetical protein
VSGPYRRSGREPRPDDGREARPAYCDEHPGRAFGGSLSVMQQQKGGS